ncbi:MAG: ATP-binding cassette domain-containing protein, partial [Paracoccaceae bacterium]
MLKLDGLDAGYGVVQVLRGLTLEARAGEVTCVMGRNGAGKTTMLRAVMGQVALTTGAIFLDDVRIDTLPAHEVARHGIGYVPQGRRLFGPLTVAENLEIGLMARGCGAATRARVLDLFPR